ncbi:MAG: hypothetical protein ACE5IC_07030 [Candidatus Brocadiales bacterium]
MERNIDLIIWALLFLLLFGGSIIKAFLRWRVERREEAKKPLTERKRHTFREELKKTLEEMMVKEEGPEIVIEEIPHRKRARRLKVREEPPAPGPQGPTAPTRRVKLTSLAEPPKPKTRHEKVPLSERLPKDELQKAIVMSEILGPPRSRRRTHRLF